MAANDPDAVVLSIRRASVKAVDLQRFARTSPNTKIDHPIVIKTLPPSTAIETNFSVA